MRRPIIIVSIVLASVAVLSLSLVLGFSIGRISATLETDADPAADEDVKWTCSMHPQFMLPSPGICPLCQMDLIPLKPGETLTGPREIRLSEYAKKLAEVQVTPVERKHVKVDVRMVGRVEYDETRLGYVTAWIPGRIDRMFVNFTGAGVVEGQHMVSMFSPELIAAQEELLQAKRSIIELEKSQLAVIRDTAQLTLDAVREKLRLWGLTSEQIEKVEAQAKPMHHFTINAPISGTVIERNAREGMYVDTGTKLYIVADLSKVWVRFDAYESDITWIRYGQRIDFTVPAYPGEIFNGKVSFIDPFLSNRTRSVKVRVNVDNPEGKLKPDMFVRGVLRAEVSAEGGAVPPDYRGKWISPMHPEIVKDEPGICDVCGMDLVPGETLGFVSTHTEPPVVIPASAPLITGRRAIVYVEKEEGLYESREIVLGPRAGDWYVVRRGLEIGELVVSNGNFKIDSALQIYAKASMMNVDPARESRHDIKAEKDAPRFEVEEGFKTALDAVYSAYFEVSRHLSLDDLTSSQRAVRELFTALRNADYDMLESQARDVWMGELKHLEEDARVMRLTEDIEEARSRFEGMSQSIIKIAYRFGTGSGDTLFHIVHCPMAFKDLGADWLQPQPRVENPYWGDEMYRCGWVTGTIPSDNDNKTAEQHD